MRKYQFWKRPFDLIAVLLLIVVTSPIFVFVSLIVRFKLGSPILFKQKRPGFNGQIFTIYKFRTMLDKVDDEGNPFPDSQRLTRFGRFLRSTSLDELPELFNVLKGEMSLVGPRPLLVQYLDLYTPKQMQRHDVKPGITGWTQVNGRNHLTWEEKFANDIWYIENQSFWLDLKIIFFTASKIIKRAGISQPGHVTIQPFTGSRMT